MRTVTGSLVYKERIALPPGAEVVVRAMRGGGQAIGEIRIATKGRQVPIDFSLEIPARTAAILRAAIAFNGKIGWTGEPVDIAAGDGPLALGELMLRRAVPMGFSGKFRCGLTTITVGFDREGAILAASGRYWRLEKADGAKADRFVAHGDPGVWFERDGEGARASLGSGELPACTAIAIGGERRFRASGNEPGWSLVIENGQARLATNYGQRHVQGRIGELEVEAEYITVHAAEPGLTARIGDDLCRDSATGMPHPHSVTVVAGDQALRGCGGAPFDLLAASQWRVTGIGGDATIGKTSVTLDFLPEGRVAGSGGCNRYHAAFEIGGEGVSIGRAAATMMACQPDVMEQERRFFDALAAIRTFDFSPDGALLLRGGDESVRIRASRQ